MSIKLFTDGSCLNNQQSKKKKCHGGIGIFIIYPDNSEKSFTEIVQGDKITNQVAELMAIKKGIEFIDNSYNGILYLYTDSQYVINIFTNWIKKWESQLWKKCNGQNIENIDLIRDIYNIIKNLNFKIIFKHVKSHQIQPELNSPKYILWYGNNQADRLATFSANLSKENS
jgi:ribonuclease HI